MDKLSTLDKSQAYIFSGKLLFIITSSFLESEPLQTPSLEEICWTDGTN